ncbi:hydrogenase iron-sulfur subunit [Anaeromyxobacter terrae]|uniref:hydrogenase iron-sulfur subunit n=1 Tax=Anaeromyxobacter terrae TaxID=2925406 RepID=UPI001F59C952|nr:hydrogenase iron-sulfur subunit [Anaeromyxobacter sp. SG22]
MPHEPRIVAFLCSWCAYSAADRAGQARIEYPQSLLTVRVMCTGRVEPAFVLQAFREGADGVLVAGCHPGDCHYLDGNLRAAARHAVLVRALEQAGIEPARFRIAWASAAEGERFAATVREMTEALRALGPLAYSARALEGVGEALEDAPVPLDASLARRAEYPPRAPGKPRVAFYWNASCGGCEEAVMDLGEGLASLLERVEVVLWPVAFDHKRADVEALPDGGIDVAFVNGAVRLTEQDEWSRLLRRKARMLVSFGACAHMGGVVGLGNLSSPAELLDAAYRRPASVSNPDAPLPGGPVAGGAGLSLPVLLARALPLADVVPVDYTVPGCPPSPAIVEAALDALLGDSPPPRGAVLAPNVALCDGCPRKGSRPERLEVESLRRIATSAVDPERCFLAQGLVCLGPGTRAGCQPGCVEAGMPCRGCFGPLDGVRDPGAAMLSAFASLFAGGEAEVLALADALPDPAGTFWRYSYAAGLVPARVRPASEEDEG